MSLATKSTKSFTNVRRMGIIKEATMSPAKRGRPGVPAHIVFRMQSLRLQGFLLREIAVLYRVTPMTVYNKTVAIPHVNRHKKTSTIWRRTGRAAA